MTQSKIDINAVTYKSGGKQVTKKVIISNLIR
jgi:hypothetical protein